MNVDDPVRVTRGPWSGFVGKVTATFAGGWVAVLLAGYERTFAADDLEVIS